VREDLNGKNKDLNFAVFPEGNAKTIEYRKSGKSVPEESKIGTAGSGSELD
jgi:hypothetical protein